MNQISNIGILNFGHWDLFNIWDLKILVLGIFSIQALNWT
jgi:hypothetical protein